MRTRSLTLAALLVLLHTPAGCRDNTASARSPRKPNVVIFLIDTLRADHLGCYGFDEPTSPNIDALARSGVVFEDASSAAPWTLPSVTSLQLSQFLCEHNVVVDGQRIAAGADPLAARLKRAGYETANFYRNPYVASMTGLQKGYDVCIGPSSTTHGDTVAPWLQRIADKPFLLYVHNTEPHDPWDHPNDYDEPFGEIDPRLKRSYGELSQQLRQLSRIDHKARRPLGTTDNTLDQLRVIEQLNSLQAPIRVMYQGSVLMADESVGSVVATLKQRGLWNDTLFIVLADHGEEMGEHGYWQHDQSVYQELIHVPMVIRFPRDEFAGRSVKTPVSLVDVMPTLADYLRRPDLGKDTRGRSLMPLIHGDDAEGAELRVVSMRKNRKKYYRPMTEQRGDINVVVRDGAWKAIWNTEVDTLELYDLSNDPGEKSDLGHEQATRATQMRAFASDWLESWRSTRSDETESGIEGLSPEDFERLRSLGYIGSGRRTNPPRRSQPAPPPPSK